MFIDFMRSSTIVNFTIYYFEKIDFIDFKRFSNNRSHIPVKLQKFLTHPCTIFSHASREFLNQ